MEHRAPCDNHHIDGYCNDVGGAELYSPPLIPPKRGRRNLLPILPRLQRESHEYQHLWCNKRFVIGHTIASQILVFAHTSLSFYKFPLHPLVKTLAKPLPFYFIKGKCFVMGAFLQIYARCKVCDTENGKWVCTNASDRVHTLGWVCPDMTL